MPAIYNLGLAKKGMVCNKSVNAAMSTLLTLHNSYFGSKLKCMCSQ